MSYRSDTVRSKHSRHSSGGADSDRDDWNGNGGTDRDLHVRDDEDNPQQQQQQRDDGGSVDDRSYDDGEIVEQNPRKNRTLTNNRAVSNVGESLHLS